MTLSSKPNSPNNLAHLSRDRGYRFTTERDPDLEWICEKITLSNLSVHAICDKIYRMSSGTASVSPGTLYAWLDGRTKRPQNYTLTWVAHALAFQRKWTRER